MDAKAVEIMLAAGYPPAYGMPASPAEHNAAIVLADPYSRPVALVLAINALDAQMSGDLGGWSKASAATDDARQRHAQARGYRSEEEAGRAVRIRERDEAHAAEAAVESMEHKGQASLRRQLVARLEAAGVKPDASVPCLRPYRQLAELIREARSLRRTMENHRQGRGSMAKAVPAMKADIEARLKAAGIPSY